VALADQLRPDVVLLDVQLPDHDGFWVADELNAAKNPADVVLVSSREAADYGSRLDEVVATGFIAKSELSAVAVESLVAASS
jgi:DNA-binding NarL/FixJ family response regulator